MAQLASLSVSPLLRVCSLHLIPWKLSLFCLLFTVKCPGVCSLSTAASDHWAEVPEEWGAEYVLHLKLILQISKVLLNSRTCFFFFFFKWASLHLICSAFCELPYGVNGNLVKMYLLSHKIYKKMSNTHNEKHSLWDIFLPISHLELLDKSYPLAGRGYLEDRCHESGWHIKQVCQ